MSPPSRPMRRAGPRRGLILVVAAGSTVPDGLPPEVVVFEAPDDDPDGVFADLVGSFAAALDDGADPGEAFRASVDSDGWTEVDGRLSRATVSAMSNRTGSGGGSTSGSMSSGPSRRTSLTNRSTA